MEGALIFGMDRPVPEDNQLATEVEKLAERVTELEQLIPNINTIVKTLEELKLKNISKDDVVKVQQEILKDDEYLIKLIDRLNEV